MKQLQNIYLIGLGAIGSAYASKFHEWNPDSLKIIGDSGRIKRYTKTGIVINGKPFSFRYLRPEDSGNKADLILIAVKQHHLAEAIKAIRQLVGDETIILSLLNGITSEEIIGEAYGQDKLLYSFVVGTDAVRIGTETRFSSIGKIVFGAKQNKTYSPKVSAVKELFDQAKIPYSIPEDMIRELWWKFMMNVGINQTSAVLKAPYGVFQTVPEARELLAMASLEVILIASKAGINLTETAIQEYIGILNTLSPHGKTSMLQDVEAGRKTEVEIFAGTVVELGRRYGVATPVNDILFKMIRTMEQTFLR